MKKHKKLLLVIGALLLIALAFAGRMLRLDAYLPHKKIEIILPFDAQYDSVTSLIPMGETIYHPKPASPLGHPGLDFGGQAVYPFIASADGKVAKIKPGGSSDGTDIYINSGAYTIVYKEMDPSNVFVKVGQKVKRGEKIALPDPKREPSTPDMVHYSTHWEFASASPIRDRYCPLTYFTAESRGRIEAIWERVKPSDNGGVKERFPYICSGDYFNRVEK